MIRVGCDELHRDNRLASVIVRHSYSDYSRTKLPLERTEFAPCRRIATFYSNQRVGASFALYFLHRPIRFNIV